MTSEQRLKMAFREMTDDELYVIQDALSHRDFPPYYAVEHIIEIWRKMRVLAIQEFNARKLDSRIFEK